MGNVTNLNRNATLDFTKGILILLICFTHYTSDIVGFDLKYGFPFWVDLAVPMFMIISGYLWSVSYTLKEYENLSETYSPYEILKKLGRFLIPFSIIYIAEILIYVCSENDESLSAIVKSIIKIILQEGLVQEVIMCL